MEATGTACTSAPPRANATPRTTSEFPHWKTATFGWLAFVVASFAIGNVIGTKTIDPNASGSGESGHVMKALAAEFKQPASESVLIRSTTMTTDAPAFRRAIGDTAAALGIQSEVRQIQSPLTAGNGGQFSADRHAALVRFKLKGTGLAQSDKRSARRFPFRSERRRSRRP